MAKKPFVIKSIIVIPIAIQNNIKPIILRIFYSNMNAFFIIYAGFAH